VHGDTDDEPTDADADAAAAAGEAEDAGADAEAASVGADGAEADEADAEGASVGADGAEADEADAESGVDTEHVMNLTFVLTLLFGVPAVVVLSLFVPLDGWGEIIGFVVRVGAAIWFLTAVTLYVRERLRA